MLIKFRLRTIRVTFSLAWIEDVIGVNSNVGKDKHILMWDFDHSNQRETELALKLVQYIYDLPTIHIFNTGKPKHYIAFCFAVVDIIRATEIIASTPHICWGFLKWGIIRNKFTLRVSKKSDREHKLVAVLKSDTEPDATISDLNSWVKYETLPDWFPVKIVVREYLHGRRRA